MICPPASNTTLSQSLRRKEWRTNGDIFVILQGVMRGWIIHPFNWKQHASHSFRLCKISSAFLAKKAPHGRSWHGLRVIRQEAKSYSSLEIIFHCWICPIYSDELESQSNGGLLTGRRAKEQKWTNRSINFFPWYLFPSFRNGTTFSSSIYLIRE